MKNKVLAPLGEVLGKALCLSWGSMQRRTIRLPLLCVKTGLGRSRQEHRGCSRFVLRGEPGHSGVGLGEPEVEMVERGVKPGHKRTSLGMRAACQGHSSTPAQNEAMQGLGKCKSQGEVCERLRCDENCGGNYF